jgi:sugar phosphate isomerase/epimerase
MEILLHSYTFRNYTLEDALRAARRLGYTGIELHPVHFNPSYPDDELARCLMLADRRGLDIAVVDFKADLIQADDAAAEEAARLLERTVHVCERIGVPRLNGFTGFLAGPDPSRFSENGSALATDEDYERCADRLRPVVRVAEEAGLSLTLEIHMNTIHDTVAAALRLLNLVDRPALLAAPDPGNMFATSESDRNPAALQPLQERIGLVHLKNCALRGGEYDYSVGLSDGHVDILQYLRQFHALGYTGPFCIEYVGHGDPHERARADMDYLKRTVNWLFDGELA